MALVSSDAWKTLLIVLVGYALIELFVRKKLAPIVVIAGVIILCGLEMWAVNKRYLNDSQFVPASTQVNTFRQSASDKEILQDDDQDYRVLNLASNTFNENNTSYWHKSVGGYHAAKLRRYQELIEHYIAPQMSAAYREIATAQGDMEAVNPAEFDVLNMLNTKYFILPIDRQGNTAPILNPYAYGNAWFVDQVEYVHNANEEMDTLGEIDPRYTAVVDKRFEDALQGVTRCTDTSADIKLLEYTPNRLVYEAKSINGGVVVFSEIYYPDWTATIDGTPAPIARADYVLRAMYVPAGTHTIEMVFDPSSVHTTEAVAYIAFAIWILGPIGVIVRYFVQRSGKVQQMA